METWTFKFRHLGGCQPRKAFCVFVGFMCVHEIEVCHVLFYTLNFSNYAPTFVHDAHLFAAGLFTHGAVAACVGTF
jgi:hypothetical protein